MSDKEIYDYAVFHSIEQMQKELLDNYIILQNCTVSSVNLDKLNFISNRVEFLKKAIKLKDSLQGQQIVSSKRNLTQDKTKLKRSYYGRLFHISEGNLGMNPILEPRVPNNSLTNAGKEESSIERVCMSPFIEGCLRSISTSPMSMSFNIYSTISSPVEQFIPPMEYVKDQVLTDEVWILEPVQLAFYGRLDVFSRVDTAPDMNYKHDGDENLFTETALFNYAIYARTSSNMQGNKGSVIVVDEEDQDLEDDFIKHILPTDFKSSQSDIENF